jgi:hypothetical protein
MRCPRSEFDNPDECGSSLRSRCSGCGAENVAQAEFCNESGTPLTGQPAPPSSTPGVLEALTVLVIVYNLMCLVMLGSATLQHTAVKRISFRDALRWLSAPNSGRPLVSGFQDFRQPFP